MSRHIISTKLVRVLTLTGEGLRRWRSFKAVLDLFTTLAIRFTAFKPKMFSLPVFLTRTN
jgi:hypothetical protein